MFEGRNPIQAAANKAGTFAKNNRLFAATLLAFVAGAGSFAFKDALGVTPDEAYHYAIIKAYAKQYSPIITRQTNIAQTNDIIRLPSYLYHYLFSFPYRILDAFDLSGRTILVSLRLMNVALGVVAIALLRALLTRIAKKRLAADLAAACFALLPITMVTFGGLNYDNLTLPIVFASMLLLWSIRARPSIVKVGALLTLLEAGALTKYTFLPIAVVEFTYLALLVWRSRANFALAAFRTASKRALVVCGVLFLLGTGLFVERYGVNLVVYKSLDPPCQDLHSLQSCLTFPLNLRDYAAQHSGVKADKNIIAYGGDWYKTMVRGLIYPTSFLQLRYVAAAALGLSVVAVGWRRRLGFADVSFGRFALTAALFYLAVLYADDYHIYEQLGRPYAVNGRYLLPALPILLVPAFYNIGLAAKRLAQFAGMNGTQKFVSKKPGQ